MEDVPFYRESPEELCQGDIIRSVPHVRLVTPPLSVVRWRQGKGGRGLFDEYIYPPDPEANQPVPNSGFKLEREGDTIVAMSQVGLSMVLSHGCDIDQDPRHLLVGMIRQFQTIPEEHKDSIRKNENFQCFYLSPIGDMPESYVDLRRITSLSSEFIDRQERVASLTEEAIQALHFQWFRFITRIDMDDMTTPDPDPAPLP